ncbi:TetR/AcrR family transcriptional regulator [Cryptosporangium phraense]|uniref:TetR/AcrR family transcriptional regulator n=1 Tax=Cryptosporangium phraense TaxID=2593070 RepID=UPI00197AA94B|nr:TetR/AcrR family transcriptional regulator [Cryptosporangium phraense]
MSDVQYPEFPVEIEHHSSGLVTWRERKKQATRDAIGEAAFKLALEVGPGNVRVDDIAAAAGVSPRTFNNYFSSREQAICTVRMRWADALGAALTARPPGEPLDRVLCETILEVRGQGEHDKAITRMLAATEAMRAEYLRNSLMVEFLLAEVIAGRTGCDPLAARVVGGAFAGAIRAAGEYWLRDDGDLPFTDFLRAALERVAPAARALEDAPFPHQKSERESQAC